MTEVPTHLYIARYRCCHRVAEALVDDNQPGPPALYQPRVIDIDNFVFHALHRGQVVERIPLAEAGGLRFGCGCPVALDPLRGPLAANQTFGS